jgi:hypothetical protein
MKTPVSRSYRAHKAVLKSVHDYEEALETPVRLLHPSDPLLLHPLVESMTIP